jgi:hypothetical protein
MMGDPMVLSESETVELRMSAQMISKNCAHCAKIVQRLGTLCKNKNVLEVGIKKSFYIETTRLHEINTEEGKWKI